MGKQKGYSEDFKLNIVKLHNSGKSVGELVGEYGISKTTVNLWIKPANKKSIGK